MSRFKISRFSNHRAVLRSEMPLNETQMFQAAPSIFATGKHISRSARYTYIPTIEILQGLRHEGFEAFMVAQNQCRLPGKSDFTKHMIRLRYAGQLACRTETNEIILVNSHDGASSYQMLAGVFRFVCCNGLVFGEAQREIRIPHKGDIRDQVIEGAFHVLEDFAVVNDATSAMKGLALSSDEQHAFAGAALALRYDRTDDSLSPAPVSAEQLLEARRTEDVGDDLWTTFQRVQENLLKGGQNGRNSQGRRVQTRAIHSISRSVNLNRALWSLAEKMRQLKA